MVTALATCPVLVCSLANYLQKRGPTFLCPQNLAHHQNAKYSQNQIEVSRKLTLKLFFLDKCFPVDFLYTIWTFIHTNRVPKRTERGVPTEQSLLPWEHWQSTCRSAPGGSLPPSGTSAPHTPPHGPSVPGRHLPGRRLTTLLPCPKFLA